MTADSTQSSPEPLARLRDYELLSRLGQGGMGAVYLARHAHLDKQVAVKLLPREHLRNPEMVARFKREMKAVGKLHHPNIIQAFDGGEERGIHFLVMEYAEGLDLNTLLAKYGKLPISDACEIIRQAAVGLEHAHLHGLVHRDIKPANILLSWPQASSLRGTAAGNAPAADPATESGQGGSSSPRDDSVLGDEPRATVDWSGSGASSGVAMQPVVKVLDLGLALLNTDKQSLAKGITGTGQIMGTLDYMAPEQTSDTHTVDIRADIYSLGCTLYALLAGAPPYSGGAYTNAYQKIVAHNQHSPRPLHEIRKNVPPAVVTILNKMLAKNPDDRYTTPIEVAAALAPYCHGNTLLSTLVEAEARAAEHNSRSDAATQELNSSALEGTATGAADEHRYSISTDDELLALLRPAAIDETIVTQPAPKLPETRIQLNVPTTPAVKLVRQTRSLDGKRLRLQVLTAVVCAVLAIISTAVVLRIKNNYGTIELTLYHKDAQVTVDGDAVRLRPGTGDDEYLIRIAPGQHKLQVEKDGYTTFTRDLEIAKGEEKIVAITLLRDAPNVASTLRRAEPAPNPKSEITNLKFEEPPPLEEWLQGREILTVKQDGTAMFTKIQDAIDALKSGQVVEVLDQGPYVETLSIPGALADTGLISRTGSVVRVADWEEQPDSTDAFRWTGHRVVSPNGIRISGFVFHSDERPGSREMFLYSCSITVLEQCIFLTKATGETHRNLQTSVVSRSESAFGILIRDCAFESGHHFGVQPLAGETPG